jgi:hypothetical protein
MNAKHITVDDMDIIPLALERLKEMTGIVAKMRPGHKHENARIAIEDRRNRAEFIVEVKRMAGNAVAAQLAGMKEPHILVTNYVNPLQAERYKKMGLQFLDCAGNAYIHTATIFVFIKGNKRTDGINARPARLFKPAGLQVVFALLCNPDLMAATYRDIADKAGVALGTVAWAVKDLQHQGYCIELGIKGRRLVKREALLKLWLAGYEQLLRPKLVANRYHAEKQDWWQDAEAENALWGREIAAYKMIGFLKPELVKIGRAHV